MGIHKIQWPRRNGLFQHVIATTQLSISILELKKNVVNLSCDINMYVNVHIYVYIRIYPQNHVKMQEKLCQKWPNGESRDTNKKEGQRACVGAMLYIHISVRIHECN